MNIERLVTHIKANNVVNRRTAMELLGTAATGLVLVHGDSLPPEVARKDNEALGGGVIEPQQKAHVGKKFILKYIAHPGEHEPNVTVDHIAVTLSPQHIIDPQDAYQQHPQTTEQTPWNKGGWLLVSDIYESREVPDKPGYREYSTVIDLHEIDKYLQTGSDIEQEFGINVYGVAQDGQLLYHDSPSGILTLYIDPEIQDVDQAIVNQYVIAA